MTVVPEDLVTPEAVVPVRPATEDDLTAFPDPLLGTLAIDEIDDLEDPLAELEDLVAVDVLVVAPPLLALVIEELLVPVVLDMEPIPLLVLEPVVEILGLYVL